MSNPRHPANTADTVRALLAEQHPDLLELGVGKEHEGADMVMYRVGEELAVRLPRSENTVESLEAEARWLGLLSADWTFPFPRVLRRGVPGCGFPFPWSVVTWLPGSNAAEVPLHADAGIEIARALAQMHAVAPPDAPFNEQQSGPMASREHRVSWALETLAARPGPEGRMCDVDAARGLWEQALAAPEPLERVWSHADLHALNVISLDGEFGGIVDWADMSGCDRAVDLGFLYTLVTADAVDQAVAEYGRLTGAVDDALVSRVRGVGLAMSLGLSLFDQAAARDMGWLGLKSLGVVR